MQRISIYIIFVLLSACNWLPDKHHVNKIAQLPDFKILSIDSSRCISSRDMENGCPIVFLYYSPDCEHCQRETKAILDHSKELKNTKIYWITNEPAEEAKIFYTNYRLDTLRNGFVGQDYNYSFYKAYLPPTIPYIAIYNKNKKLVKVYNGEIDIQSIIRTVQD